MSTSSRGPSAEDWEQLKPEIRQLYLVEKRQLKEVLQVMKDRHRFEATERMYKSRLKNWNFDTKKIREADWRYMLKECLRRRQEGKDSEFRVHGRRKTMKDIQRYLKRKDVTQELFLMSSPPESLSPAGIEVSTPRSPLDTDSEPDPSFAAPPRDALVDKRFSNSGLSEEPPSPAYHVPEPRNGPLPASSHVTRYDATVSPTGVWGHTRPMSYFSPLAGTRTSTNHSSTSGSLSTPACTSSQSPNSVRGVEGMALRAMTPEKYTLDDSDELIGYRLMSGSPLPIGSRICYIDHDSSTTTVSVPEDLSYGNILIRRDSGISVSEDTSERLNDLDSHEHLASRWASRYFFACICINRRQDNLAIGATQEALEMFEQMLRTQNRYLLTGLSLMSSILNGHGQDKLLQQFLCDSCRVIDKVHGPEHTISIPYRYMLAVISEDKAHVKHYGEQLLNRTHIQLGLIWGSESPNELVGKLYRNFHLLDSEGQIDQAVQESRKCFTMSEKIMGRNHLITVSCLATLSRALDRRGNSGDAIEVLMDAVERCKLALSANNPFRLKLLERLGQLCWRVGQLDAAETYLRDVATGRANTLGLSVGHTWGAINNYSSLLKNRGKFHDDARFLQLMQHLHQQEQGFAAGADAY